MQLFYRRPLCFFCCLFLIVSLLVCLLPSAGKLLLLGLIAFLCGAVFVCLFLFHSQRVRLVYLLLCLLFVGGAMANHYVRVDLKERRLSEMEGTHTLEAVVLDKVSSGSHFSEYVVETEDFGAGKTRMLLLCAFDSPLEVGDRLACRASVTLLGSEVLGEVRTSEDCELVGCVYEITDLARLSQGERHPSILFASVRRGCASYMRTLFGEREGSLAAGVLLGDTDGIAPSEIRDLRRSGVFHLLSVSGLHMSVLMGGLELLLRHLRCPRGARCGLLSVAALAFLILTGFSPSATRSVIMLLLLYLAYLFWQEYDGITALFLAVAVICMVDPKAISDLGLWMSFLATLGILSVYPLLQGFLIRQKKRAKGRRLPLLGLSFLGAVLLSAVCNVFLLWISCFVFGEFSLVSFLANPILSPLGSVFMIVTVISLPLGLFPAVAPYLTLPVRLLADLILRISRFFSMWRGAMISLRYPFAMWIVAGMSIALCVMLVIRLKHKWHILLPPALASLLLVGCVLGYGLSQKGKIQGAYVGNQRSEIFVLAKGVVASVVDCSDGSLSLWLLGEETAKDRMTTEYEEWVLTHYHQKQIDSFSYFAGRSVIRRLVLPIPKTDADREVARELCSIAEAERIEIMFYEDRETVPLLGKVAFCPLPASAEGHGAYGFALSYASDTVCYFGKGYFEGEPRAELSPLILGSRGVFLGAHGTVEGEERVRLLQREDAFLWISSEKRAGRFSSPKGVRRYAPTAPPTVFPFVLEENE